ncbi:hypothetical protein CCACVL1_30390 [Corchorus capsularis]|uniref:Uncharacterized protein n=2 Tax=Corchorus capsularis TaxID=210143 RepID=A0A1R3FXF3_COCAP|nr:hypothetical protein CCACVL1_30390 [Corchorus capsularis]
MASKQKQLKFALPSLNRKNLISTVKLITVAIGYRTKRREERSA